MVSFGRPPTAPSELELSRVRVKRGQCPTCGLQTGDIVNQGFFRGTKLVPLTNEYVVGGRCLLCNPLDSVGMPSVTALPVIPILPLVQVMDNSFRQSSEPMEEDVDGEVLIRLSSKTPVQNEQINTQTNIPVPDMPPEENVSSSGVEQSENKRNPFAIAEKPDQLCLLITVIVVVAIGIAVAVRTAIEPTLSRGQLVKNEIERNVLQRNATFNELSQNDRRNVALNWLLDTDILHLNTGDSNLNQRYILALLAYEFGSIFMSSTNWLSDKDECKWDGVTCLVNGEVYELLLDKQNLTGTLPPEISKLQFLQQISVYENSLSGSLPPELGNLAELKTLFLGHNKLSGTIPSELGGLRRLTKLSLLKNQFRGTLPSQFGNLKELIEFSADENQLTGTFSPELCHFRELTDLWLHKNMLSGTLPPELHDMRKLAALSIYKNRFTGTIPSELGNLKQLTHLDLAENIFTGTIPSELGNINTLAFLDLRSNQLTGTLPSTLVDLQDLELYTNDNRLSARSQSLSMSMSM